MDELEVVLQTAVAAATIAQEEGVARRSVAPDTLYASARATVLAAREGARVWFDAGVIPAPPPSQ